jgi:hypothetical protein
LVAAFQVCAGARPGVFDGVSDEPGADRVEVDVGQRGQQVALEAFLREWIYGGRSLAELAAREYNRRRTDGSIRFPALRRRTFGESLLGRRVEGGYREMERGATLSRWKSYFGAKAG